MFLFYQKYLTHSTSEGFYLMKSTPEKLIDGKISIQQESGHVLKRRAFGNALTDVFGTLQVFYDHWISPAGGAGNLVDRLPAKFSTAEHLIYDDYQIVGK